MSDIAKIFMTGRSQAVRLPAQYRFETSEVFIRRDPETGDVILSARPTDWDGFFALPPIEDDAHDFLGDRSDPPQERELF
jgi:antitoxin VapB